jgi:hypothetical protein
MLDRIFAVISMLGVIVFVGIVTVGVMEIDLWIVALVVIGIAILDFSRLLRNSDKSSDVPGN